MNVNPPPPSPPGSFTSSDAGPLVVEVVGGPEPNVLQLPGVVARGPEPYLIQTQGFRRLLESLQHPPLPPPPPPPPRQINGTDSGLSDSGEDGTPSKNGKDGKACNSTRFRFRATPSTAMGQFKYKKGQPFQTISQKSWLKKRKKEKKKKD